MRFKSSKSPLWDTLSWILDDFGAWTRWSADVEIPGTAQKFDLGCTNNPAKKMTPRIGLRIGLLVVNHQISTVSVIDKWTSTAIRPSEASPCQGQIGAIGEEVRDLDGGRWSGRYMVDTPWSSLPRFYHWPRSNERSDGHDGPLEWVASFFRKLDGMDMDHGFWAFPQAPINHQMNVFVASIPPIRRHVHFCWMHLLFFSVI